MRKDISKVLDYIMVPINRAGWPFIALFFIITLVLGFIWAPLFWPGLALSLWCIYFFRDPKRMVPQREGLLVSPADGLISAIVSVVPPSELGLGEEERTRISVFLSVFDVHVNRVPADVEVKDINYIPGRFFNASLDKASEENERNLITLKLASGEEIGVVQIAGLVARRIVCQTSVGQKMRAGERFGLIRFGSRVDLYLPRGAQPLVVVGQKAVAGETIFADLTSQESLREGKAV